MPPLGIAPRLSAPQAEVLLLYYSGNNGSKADTSVHSFSQKQNKHMRWQKIEQKLCAGRESNPGLVRGRDVYYHCTTGKKLQILRDRKLIVRHRPAHKTCLGSSNDPPSTSPIV